MVALLMVASLYKDSQEEVCAPLDKPGDTCIGTLVQLRNGEIYRVWPHSTSGGDRSPHDIAVLKEEGKIANATDQSEENFPRMAAQFVSQTPP